MTKHAPSMFRAIAACAAVAMATSGAWAQRILIDLGPAEIGGNGATTNSPDLNGNDWTNFMPGDLLRLVDTTGGTTGGESPLGIAFTASTPLGSSGGNNNGLTNPNAGNLADLAIATATQDYAFRFVSPGQTLAFELSSLDLNSTYNFRFFGSRVATGTQETQYTVTGGNGSQSVSLITGGTGVGGNGANDDTIVGVADVTPTGAGTIAIDLAAPQAGFVYLNVLEVEVIPPDVLVEIGVQPTDLLVPAGGTLVFTASVQSSEPGLTLQWELDGVPLVNDTRVSGAMSDTLTIAPAGLTDVGTYRLVASNGGYVVNSNSVVGGVRGSPFGLADFNNDGSVNFFDVIEFLRTFDEAGG